MNTCSYPATSAPLFRVGFHDSTWFAVSDIADLTDAECEQLAAAARPTSAPSYAALESLTWAQHAEFCLALIKGMSRQAALAGMGLS